MVAQFCGRATADYRIGEGEAAEAFWSALDRPDPKLRAAINAGATAEQISRLRGFKEATRRARQEIYYGLRRYWQDTAAEAIDVLTNLPTNSDPETISRTVESVTRLHVSTRERAGHQDDFYRQVGAFLDGVKTILDVGCGVQPLAFPFDTGGAGVEIYVAAEPDAAAVSALQAYARNPRRRQLIPLSWRIENGWTPILAAAKPVVEFDLALLLKLVPVMERQQPELLETLSRIPARKLLITGCRQALVKKETIERREKAVLRKFMDEFGFRTIGELETEDEVGWLVKRIF